MNRDNPLGDYSVEELEGEIERRNIDRPQLLHKPDITNLAALGEEYLNTQIEGTRFKDAHYHFYEKSLLCLYGTKIFDFLRTLPEGDD